MTIVRINKDYKVLIRYGQNMRGYEWICVKGYFAEYNADVWEIWRREISIWKKRIPWEKVFVCRSIDNMIYMWEKLTGIRYEYND